MKKYLLLSSILIIPFYSHCQKTDTLYSFLKNNEVVLKNKPDSIIHSIWNVENMAWFYNNRNVYFFDSLGNLTNEINANWDDDLWKLENRTDYIFSDNLITEQINYWWDWYYIEWMYVTKYSFSFDSLNNLTETRKEKWSEDNLSWENDSLYTYEYSDSNQILYYTKKKWSRYYNMWENITQIEYIYDSIGNMLEQIESEWEFDLLIWEAKSKNIFVYDNNNKLIEQVKIEIDKNDLNNVWKKEYTYYINGAIKDYAFYIWVSINNSEYWLEDYKFSYTYNELNDFIEKTEYVFDWDLLIWEKKYATAYSYYDDHSLNTATYNIWSGNQWNKLEQSKYYYPGYTNIPIKERLDNLKVYPVPANDRLTIVLPDEFSGTVHIQIYDIYGRKVAEYQDLINNDPINIALPELKSGVYMLNLIIKNDVFIRKIIIGNK